MVEKREILLIGMLYHTDKEHLEASTKRLLATTTIFNLRLQTRLVKSRKGTGSPGIVAAIVLKQAPQFLNPVHERKNGSQAYSKLQSFKNSEDYGMYCSRTLKDVGPQTQNRYGSLRPAIP